MAAAASGRGSMPGGAVRGLLLLLAAAAATATAPGNFHTGSRQHSSARSLHQAAPTAGAAVVTAAPTAAGATKPAAVAVVAVPSPANTTVTAATATAGGTAAAVPARAAANASSAAAANTTSARPKNWRPSFPFPQCMNTTLNYDVSFVGDIKYLQVGTVKYAYHRFGPLKPKSQQAAAPAGGAVPGIFSLANPGARKRENSPVVFISGWGMQMYMWPVPLLTRLAEDREVIIFDNMRTGLTTDTSTEKLSIPMMANSTAALITKLGLKQPDIFSWSVGGFVAYALLAFHPEKIGNVIIVAGSPGGPDARLSSLNVVTDLIQIGTNYTALFPYLFPEGAKDEGVCSFFAALNSFYNSKNTKLTSPLGKKSLEEQAWAVWDFFNDPTVANILTANARPNPVLILHGVQDRVVNIRNAGLGASKLLGSWMLQFAGQGHGIPFEHIRAVIGTTLEFFSFANPLTSAEMQEWADQGAGGSSFTPQQLSAAIAAESALKPPPAATASSTSG